MMNFEWDAKKALSNIKKHGISFEEAITAFDDPLVLILADDLHSDIGDRYLLIGESNKQRILMVAFTEKEGKSRIVSARKATAKERRFYEEGP